MTDNIISTDRPLTPEQAAVLKALQDVLIPASDDGRMPSASHVDFVAHLDEQAPEFLSPIASIIEQFPSDFASLDFEARLAHVKTYSEAAQAQFQQLLFHVYAAYYQSPVVLERIGVGVGPPFPRGNKLAQGDLSLLDPVMRSDKGYRRA